MKIRSGFVSNSSSSSFVVCERRDIKDREEMLEYLKSHESCVGYVDIYNGIYFDIKDELRDEILASFDEVHKCFVISDGFQLCGEDGFYVTEDMVGCTVSISSGWDGGYADRYLGISDFFNSLSDAINVLSRITRTYKDEIQIIARIDGDGTIPLVGRELSDPSTLDVKNIREGWVPYEKFVSENPWF